MSDVTVGDIREIRLTVGTDLTNATTKQLKIHRPGDDVLTKTATAYGAATGGILTYTTVGTDFNAAGEYRVSARLVFSGGDDVESPAPAVVYCTERLA